VASKVGVPIAVGGVVVAVGVVLGGTFVFAGDESERGGGQTAGPAPTTVLSLPEPGPSGEEPIPEPGDPYPPVPSGQVDGLPYSTVRITGRNLYIPVLDSNCWREEVWPRGEYADRVEVEIRELPPTQLPEPTAAEGVTYTSCRVNAGQNNAHAVIELAEPLGDRRLVVSSVIVTASS
jgi:hypothetical protein